MTMPITTAIIVRKFCVGSVEVEVIGWLVWCRDWKHTDPALASLAFITSLERVTKTTECDTEARRCKHPWRIDK